MGGGGLRPEAEGACSSPNVHANFHVVTRALPAGFGRWRLVPMADRGAGLVTLPTSGKLEIQDAIKRRIDEAAKVFSPLRPSSPLRRRNAAFGLPEEGNVLTEEM